MKTCKKCGGTEFYTKCHGGCKACHKACAAANADRNSIYNAVYREVNKEKIKVQRASYRKANAEKVKEQKRAAYHRLKESNPEHLREKSLKSAKWKAANVDKVKREHADYRARNKDKIKAQQSLYREANKEQLNADGKARRNADPEKAAKHRKRWADKNHTLRNIYKINRRARERGNGGALSAGLAVRLYSLQEGTCACGCGTSLELGYHMDHIMPTALGGANEDWNIQLLTPSCNMSKGSKHPDVWATELNMKGIDYDRHTYASALTETAWRGK